MRHTFGMLRKHARPSVACSALLGGDVLATGMRLQQSHQLSRLSFVSGRIVLTSLDPGTLSRPGNISFVWPSPCRGNR